MNVAPNLKKQDVIEIAISASRNTDMSKANIAVEIKEKIKTDNENDPYDDDENFEPTNKKNGKSSNISEKFRRVGIIGSESDFYGNNEKEDLTDPLTYPYVTDEANKKQFVQLYIAYERIQEVCLGVHSVEAVSGMNRFNLQIDGLDFFPIFPIPPSLQKIKYMCALRKIEKMKTQL